MEPQLCPETAQILLSKSVPADNSNKLALKQELNKVTVSREVSGAPVKGVTERRHAKRSRNGAQDEESTQKTKLLPVLVAEWFKWSDSHTGVLGLIPGPVTL